MKKLTIICALLLVCLCALFAAAENNLWYAYLTEDGNILVADFTYQGERISELTLGKGEERYVSVNGTEYVSFYSAGSYVAQIEEDGTLTAGDPGESRVRVYVTPTHYVEIKIIVRKVPASIELNKKQVTVLLGSTQTLSYTLSKNSTGAVSFLSSDDSVAWVDENGTIHPVNEGSCVITAATYNGLESKCSVSVEMPAPAQVITNPCTGYEFETVQIPFRLDGGYEESVSFSSSDESVLTVDRSGIASCRKAGTADVTITASRGGKAVCRVTVLPCASAVIAKESTVYLFEGGVYRPEAVTQGGSGHYEIISRNEAIAAVQNGELHALQSGSTGIDLVAPGNAKTAFALIVLPCPEALAFECPDSVAMGEQVQVNLSSGAYPLPKIVFSSSDESVLTVTPDGKLDGHVPGTAELTATVGSVAFTRTVTVDFMAKSLRFDRDAVTLSPGDSMPLNVQLDGGIGQVTFRSSDESVVSIHGSRMTAEGIGNALIYASLKNGVSGMMSVTVNPAPGSIRFSAATVTLGRGDRYEPAYEFESGHIALINWSSSDESIATVSSDGTVSAGKTNDICTVTAATNKGVSASFRVIVSNPPGMPDIAADALTQDGLFTHYLSLPQGTACDLGIRFPGYDSVTFRCESSDKDLLTVTPGGTITALKTGTARVSVKVYDGTTAEILVEITK